MALYNFSKVEMNGKENQNIHKSYTLTNSA